MTDDFEDGTLAPLWNTWGSGIHESGGRANIVFTLGVYSESGAGTKGTYDLRECDVVLEVVEAPNLGEDTNAYLTVFQDGGNLAWITLDIGAGIEFYAQTNSAAVKPAVEIPFDAVQHRHWRIGERQGTTFMQTSPDGIAWVDRFDFPTQPWAASVRIEFYAASAPGNLQPGAFRVDNLNLAPLTTPVPGCLNVGRHPPRQPHPKVIGGGCWEDVETLVADRRVSIACIRVRTELSHLLSAFDLNVIPAKAGIQTKWPASLLDSRFRGNDGWLQTRQVFETALRRSSDELSV